LSEKSAPIARTPVTTADTADDRADTVARQKPLQVQSRKFDEEPYDPKLPSSGPVNAVVYSYKNEFGQVPILPNKFFPILHIFVKFSHKYV
jgi:hypothetical protein